LEILGKPLYMTQRPPQFRDERDPTRWFVAILIVLAVAAAIIALDRFMKT
jgi:hypothetical protein